VISRARASEPFWQHVREAILAYREEEAAYWASEEANA
jgi:hypothetical protein